MNIHKNICIYIQSSVLQIPAGGRKCGGAELIYLSIHIYIHTHIHIHIHMCVCIFMYTYMNLYMCLHCPSGSGC